MDQDKEALKECPFCGSDDIHICLHEGIENLSCGECGAVGPDPRGMLGYPNELHDESEARAVTRDELLGAMEAAFVSGAIAFAKLNGNPVNMSLAVFAMEAWESSDKEEYTIMKRFPAPSDGKEG